MRPFIRIVAIAIGMLVSAGGVCAQKGRVDTSRDTSAMYFE